MEADQVLEYPPRYSNTTFVPVRNGTFVVYRLLYWTNINIDKNYFNAVIQIVYESLTRVYVSFYRARYL